MKVRLLIDASEFDRFVVAKYYAGVATSETDKIRTRATRRQMRRFIESMLRTVTRDLAKNLPARSYAAARHLEEPLTSYLEPTLALLERDQRSFPW